MGCCPPPHRGSVRSVMAADARWADVGRRHPGLHLLVLLGSRATGTAHARSDWDVGALVDPGFDLLSLRVDVVDAVGTDDVDLVDLATASAVLRRDAATDGVVLFERATDTFVEFQIEAALFWCDIEPVIRRAHADVLRTMIP